MLWTVFAVLLMLWLVSVVAGIGGLVVHSLLVVALAILTFNLWAEHRTIV